MLRKIQTWKCDMCGKVFETLHIIPLGLITHGVTTEERVGRNPHDALWSITDKQVCPKCGMIGLPDRIKYKGSKYYEGARFVEGDAGQLIVYAEERL